MLVLLQRGIELGFEQNILVFDADAPPNRFTKKLIVLVKTVARRNFGWNINRIYLPSEALSDVVEWIPTKKFMGDPKPLIFWGIRLIFIDELGEDQEYQEFFLRDLRGSLHHEDFSLGLGTDGNHFILCSY